MNTSDIKNMLVGKTLEAANEILLSSGLKSRVKSRDGINFVLTMDFKQDRVNLVIVNDLIADVEYG